MNPDRFGLILVLFYVPLKSPLGVNLLDCNLGIALTMPNQLFVTFAAALLVGIKFIAFNTFSSSAHVGYCCMNFGAGNSWSPHRNLISTKHQHAIKYHGFSFFGVSHQIDF